MLDRAKWEDSMRVKAILGVACMVALAGCNPQEKSVEAPVPAAAPQQAAAPMTPAEPLDPFVVMIGAERWTVILDKALDAAREAPDPASSPERTDMYRADAALKRGAAMAIEVRNDVCGKGLVTGAACNLPEWPAWTRELPTGDTPIAEIEKRSDWLSSVMSPFTDAACASGRKTSGDELFCSVE
jgi:hypothetical protein